MAMFTARLGKSLLSNRGSVYDKYLLTVMTCFSAFPLFLSSIRGALAARQEPHSPACSGFAKKRSSKGNQPPAFAQNGLPMVPSVS